MSALAASVQCGSVSDGGGGSPLTRRDRSQMCYERHAALGVSHRRTNFLLSVSKFEADPTSGSTRTFSIFSSSLWSRSDPRVLETREKVQWETVGQPEETRACRTKCKPSETPIWGRTLLATHTEGRSTTVGPSSQVATGLARDNKKPRRKRVRCGGITICTHRNDSETRLRREKCNLLQQKIAGQEPSTIVPKTRVH
ncbi:hypothetical protein ASPSYDRAFT_32302 [Aspergillus sydowii CBS 593.65]|uniref:Uncharacterized protein n=1 Tax=Aspergillus sydowii CBS 593.65 TaxID=1036612 RepID=A0A1L9TFN2_9EURO|nr:uncharacterized protein ASPSYDRAFT_32302 [Aspergillus sydowii CBS 593.65]OJJ58244.1 hypothetical protein ASPSYDRAFT_32302 [Aspergillus sydowii CBS 593.65]